MNLHKHVLVVAVAMLTGCTAEVHEPAVSAQRTALIGGFEGDSPTLNAVGSVSRLYLSQPAAPLPEVDAGVTQLPNNLPLAMACTGALIDERTVVTAKSCAAEYAAAARGGGELVFTLGPDARQPVAYATVIAVETAPGDTGGFSDRGHDISVLHLREPVQGVPTVKLAELDNSQVGQSFAAIGFGVIDNASNLQRRRIGAMTLRAVEGKTYEQIFGSFDVYFKARHRALVPPQCVSPTPEDTLTEACVFVQRARQVYDATLLEQSGDAVLSSQPGGAQPCYGDVGGPLLRVDDAGAFVAYGVVSAGVSSDSLTCDLGAVYSRFTPEIVSFLEQAKAWQDPCQSLPPVTTCDGEHVRRCSSNSEGKRRVIELDCTTLGLRCVDAEAGATCQ